MKKLVGLIIIALFSTDLMAQAPVHVLPNIMNKYPNVRDICISPNGNEMYFTVQSFKKEFAAIVVLTKTDDIWSNGKVASFSGQFTDLEPSMSANGLTLYFASNRPKKDGKKTEDFDIWYTTRLSINDPWSEPKNIGEPINTSKDEFYPSVAANGNLYFTASYETSKGKEDIYISEYKNGNYTKPYSLASSINTEGWEFNAYIAPDELYILFSSTNHENNLGGGDLFISFKDHENNWVQAENLGIEINSPKLDFCPFVDTKTNTFYFSSEKTNINKSFGNKQTLESLLKQFNQSPNGMTRIYSLPFEQVTK